MKRSILKLSVFIFVSVFILSIFVAGAPLDEKVLSDALPSLNVKGENKLSFEKNFFFVDEKGSAVNAPEVLEEISPTLEFLLSDNDTLTLSLSFPKGVEDLLLLEEHRLFGEVYAVTFGLSLMPFDPECFGEGMEYNFLISPNGEECLGFSASRRDRVNGELVYDALLSSFSENHRGEFTDEKGICWDGATYRDRAHLSHAKNDVHGISPFPLRSSFLFLLLRRRQK